MRKVTMDDVAKRANVSVATVSRVYTNPNIVSPKNRDKVLRVIEELNYLPNALARNLRRLRTNTILVVTPNITNTLISHILKTIQNVAFNNGYRVLLGVTDTAQEMEEEYFHLLQEKVVDGAILVFPSMDPLILQNLVENQPVVIVGHQAKHTNIPSVINDNCLSSRIATEHLLKLGHRRIAYFSGPLTYTLSRERRKGYQLAIESYGLEMDDELVFEGDFYFESGYDLALNLLSSPNPPTALVAASDEMAIGAMKAARQCGVSLPSEFAIIGFDDIKMASYCDPPLSTMAQPKEAFGKISTEMLLNILRGETQENNIVLLNDQLVIRESCGKHLV